MRYLLALICPPLALLACGRPWQAVAAVVVEIVGLSTMSWGIGYVLICGCIFWAMNAISNEQARIVTQQFVRSVRPLRMFRN